MLFYYLWRYFNFPNDWLLGPTKEVWFWFKSTTHVESGPVKVEDGFLKWTSISLEQSFIFHDSRIFGNPTTDLRVPFLDPDRNSENMEDVNHTTDLASFMSDLLTYLILLD